MYETNCHDLFCISVKYHENISKGIQAMERTPKIIKGEITQKVRKQELSFLFATHHHDLFYISVKYHENIPKGIQVIERTRNHT